MKFPEELVGIALAISAIIGGFFFIRLESVSH